jgi:hypothetical protein
MAAPARLLLSFAAAAALASAQLNLQTWPNTAFAPPQAAVTTLVPGISFQASAPAPLCADFSSLRFTGTITDAATELVQFTANTDGGVRLWIDDHLVVTDGGGHNGDGKPSLRQAFLKIPFVAGVPQPFRLEYSRWTGAAPPTLELWWAGNATAMQIVPATAFAPVVAAAEVQRVATRDRLVSPSVPWQTYDNPTMGSHVNMPSGLRIDSTLANASDGGVLGDLKVFRRSHPALLLAGLHSLNGSDYTQLSVGRWGALVCDVSFESTVVNGELYFLASSNGSDCAGLLLLVRPLMMEERFGTMSLGADNASVTATLPGFAPITVRAVGAAPVPFSKGGDVYIALPLADGGVVGYATGYAAQPPPVAAMQAAIAAARAIVLASFAKYGDLADIYEAMASILAWNTMFTPVEGVVTPVSRGWDFGAGVRSLCASAIASRSRAHARVPSEFAAETHLLCALTPPLASLTVRHFRLCVNAVWRASSLIELSQG